MTSGGIEPQPGQPPSRKSAAPRGSRPASPPAAAAASLGFATDGSRTVASESIWSRLQRDWPAMIASIAVHGVLFTLLAVLTWTAARRSVEPVSISGDWFDRPAGGGSDHQPVQIDVSALKGAANAAAPVEIRAETGPPAVRPVGVAGALSGRGGAGGGGAGDGGPGAGGIPGKPSPPSVRKSIDAALGWIVRQQGDDGRWKLTGPYSNPGTIETDAGATALALLALIGDGHTHRGGKHQQAVQQGIDWLRGQQRPNGDLFDIEEEGQEAHFYSHAMGTIALCEVLALTGDESVRPAADKAVRFLIDSQNPVNGGWKYRPLTETGVGDLSVTGWALMALHSARMARLEVPDSSYAVASRFLDAVQEAPTDASRYRYRPDEPPQAAQRWSMSAEGLLCRQWLGWPRDYPPLLQGVEYLTAVQNEPLWEADRRNVYAWYYTAQVLHNLGGETWDDWFGKTSDLIVRRQDTAGSWNPERPKGAFLEWSHGGGRLYFTVMCTLILETPTRHRAIYADP